MPDIDNTETNKVQALPTRRFQSSKRNAIKCENNPWMKIHRSTEAWKGLNNQFFQGRESKSISLIDDT